MDPDIAAQQIAAFCSPVSRLSQIRPRPIKASLFSGSACSSGLHERLCAGAVIDGSCDKCGALILHGTA